MHIPLMKNSMRRHQTPALHTTAHRPRSISRACAAAVLVMSAVLPVLGQTDQTWIQGNASNDWSTTAANWSGPVPWTQGNNAIFGGTGETVEVASDLTVNNITFNSSGYEIADADSGSLFNLSAASILTVTTANHVATISEAINAGGFTKAGAGILVLAGANQFAGDVSVTAGRLSLGHNLALGTTAGTTTLSGSGQIELLNGVTITGETLYLGTGGSDFFGGLRTAENATATWAGPVILQSGGRLGSLGGGVLEISGGIQSGTTTNLIISATTSAAGLGTVRLSGTNNTYTGTTTVFRGRLQIGNTDALPVGTTLDLDSTSAVEDSVFDLNGFNQTLAGLTRSGTGSGTGGSIITNNGTAESRLTLNITGSNTYDGVLQDGTGVLALTKTGAGTMTLTGDSSYTGITQVSAGALVVGSNTALGSTAGGTNVSSGARVVLNGGVVVTGETITISGTGGNNNGALQTADGTSAEWAGNIAVAGGEARLGGGVGGTLTVSGVISGGPSTIVLFSRGHNATTVLNAASTYSGDTMMFANTGAGAKLIMGVDNAISASSRLSVLSSTDATVSMVLDLNGHVLTMRALDTTARHASGNVLFVENNGSSPSVFTISDTSGTSIFNGRLRDGTGGLSFVKNGNSTQILIAPQSYTGSTTVNAGTLQVGGAVTTLGVNGALASGNIILNGGTFALNNAGANNNGLNRLSDSASITFQGGTFLFQGSELAASSETVGSLVLAPKRSTLTMTYGASQQASLTAGQFTRAANGGTLQVNGLNLGLNDSATTNVSRIFLTSAPDLAGITDALGSGINAAAKNTKIVPYLLGAVDAASGGAGTASATPNTFVTYSTTGGLRPLNLADEFTLNTFTAGHNTNITANTTAATSIAINSLVMSGTGTTISVASNQTLKVESGAILFSSGSSMNINGGILDFGTREGIVTINSTGNTFITSRIVGSAGVSYYGTGTLVVNQQSTYPGDTGLYVGTAIPQVSSTGSSGSVTSGPFGTGRIILGGSAIRASSGADVVLHNDVLFQADTTVINGAVTRTLTFAGDVTLNQGSRTLTHQSATNTFFTGVIDDGGQGYGLTIAGNSTGLLVLSGDNTYTGPTNLTGNTTVIVNGYHASSFAVSAGVLGGTGTVAGTAVIASGGTLSPGNPLVDEGRGRFNVGSGLTLQTGSVTRLEISGATFTSLDAFGGNAPGTQGYIDYVLTWSNDQGDHDTLGVGGDIVQQAGAKINVVGVDLAPQEGQIFKLLDWTDMGGSSFSPNLGDTYRTGANDSASDLDLPDISSYGLAWDVSLFASHGILVITPEPGKSTLLLGGMILMAMRRRRKNR